MEAGTITERGSSQGSAVVSVDLGGTNMRVAIASGRGEIIARHVDPTPRAESHPDALYALVRAVAEKHAVERAVVGVPGRVDHGTGRLEHAPNLPSHWAGHLSEKQLSEAVGMSVALANDADLAAVGEHRFGAGRGARDMVYMTISTGIGCGVILGDRLLHGRRSLAEVGHSVIGDDGDDARTLEGSASGTALGRLAESAGLPARGRELLELVRAGDESAIRVWDRVVRAAGFGVANLAHLFSPEVIVIGGGVGLAGDLLLESLRRALASYGPRGLPRPIRLVRAGLGDEAGLVGAAGWAIDFEPVPQREMVD